MKRVFILPALPLILGALTAADGPSQTTKPIAPPPPRTVTASTAAATARDRPRRVAIRSNASRSIADLRAANRAATLVPATQGFVGAVQVYPFAEGLLFQVYTAPGRVTDIALQPGEALVSVASGDTVRWVIGDTFSGAGAAKRTHVLVKPFASGLATNLVITTDRRSYHIALTSTAEAAMAALSWTYPQDALIALKRSTGDLEPTASVAAGLDVDSLRFGYTITGDRPAWRPLRAFDDGRQTFIEFPATLAVGEAPPLFLVDRKGDPQLVNYRLRGRFYVVDRLFEAAELRLGTKRQDVVRISRTPAEAVRRAS